MRRIILALTIIAVGLAGCGDDGGGTTEPSQFPTGSVRSWFDALQAGDAAAALELTHRQSMLIVIAVENGLADAELGPLLRRGVTDESAAEYIADFAAALQASYAENLEDVSVDDFSTVGETYAAVGVTGDGPAWIITRRAPGGLWQVDLVGTLGPALIAQLRELLEGVGDSDDADSIRKAFRDDVMPALEAAAAVDPENLALSSEMRAMERLLEE